MIWMRMQVHTTGVHRRAWPNAGQRGNVKTTCRENPAAASEPCARPQAARQARAWLRCCSRHAGQAHRDLALREEVDVSDALAGPRNVACRGGDGGSARVRRRRRHCVAPWCAAIGLRWPMQGSKPFATVLSWCPKRCAACARVRTLDKEVGKRMAGASKLVQQCV